MRIRKKSGFRSPTEQKEFLNSGEDDFFGLLSPAVSPSRPSAVRSKRNSDRSEDCAPGKYSGALDKREPVVSRQAKNRDLGRQRIRDHSEDIEPYEYSEALDKREPVASRRANRDLDRQRIRDRLGDLDPYEYFETRDEREPVVSRREKDTYLGRQRIRDRLEDLDPYEYFETLDEREPVMSRREKDRDLGRRRIRDRLEDLDPYEYFETLDEREPAVSRREKDRYLGGQRIRDRLEDLDPYEYFETLDEREPAVSRREKDRDLGRRRIRDRLEDLDPYEPSETLDEREPVVSRREKDRYLGGQRIRDDRLEDIDPYGPSETLDEREPIVSHRTEDTALGLQEGLTVSLVVKASDVNGGDEKNGLWRLYRLYNGQREEHIAEFDLSQASLSSKIILREGDYLLRQADAVKDASDKHPIRFHVGTEEKMPGLVLSDTSDHRVVLRRVGGEADYLLTIGQSDPHAVLLVRVVDSARRSLLGAVFELRSDDGRIQHIVPNEDVFSGRIHLLEGKYTLAEKTPPSGFSGIDPIRLQASLSDGGIILRERGIIPEFTTLVRLPEMENAYLLTVTNVLPHDKADTATVPKQALEADELPPSRKERRALRASDGRIGRRGRRGGRRTANARNGVLSTQGEQPRTILPLDEQDNCGSRAQTVLAVQGEGLENCPQTVLGVQEADDEDVPMKCFRIQYGDFFGAPLPDALFHLQDEAGSCQLIELSCCGRSPLICRGLGCFVLTQIQTPCGFIPMRVRFCIVRCIDQPDNARIVLEDDTPFVRVTNNRCDRFQSANLILNARSESCGCGGI